MSTIPDSRMKASADVSADAAERLAFIRFAIEAGVLRFGEFRTKAGRLSP